jgi:Tol biopolymer transport system component
METSVASDAPCVSDMKKADAFLWTCLCVVVSVTGCAPPADVRPQAISRLCAHPSRDAVLYDSDGLLYEVLLEGTEPRHRQLSGVVRNRGEWAYGGCYSPDGTRVAFSLVPRFRQPADIWILNLASGERTQVTSTENHHEESPAFSEDGQAILFWRFHDHYRDISAGSSWEDPQLMKLDLRSKEEAPVSGILRGASFVSVPQVIPRSEAVVFSAWLPEDEAKCYRDLLRISVQQSESHEFLTGGPYESAAHPWSVDCYNGLPAVSPKGDLIAFVSRRSESAEDRFVSQIWVMNLSDGSEKPLTDLRSYKSATIPAFSRDGKKIFFTSGPPYATYPRVVSELWAVDLSGNADLVYRFTQGNRPR